MFAERRISIDQLDAIGSRIVACGNQCLWRDPNDSCARGIRLPVAQREISDVDPGTAAKEAGLLRGDVIIRIDDAKITRFEDLQHQINQHVAGDEVAIRLRRNGEIIETVAKLQKLKN